MYKRQAYTRTLTAGISITSEPDGNFDLCIDALLGIGVQSREPENRMADWIQRINTSGALILSIDIPSGLNADTGSVTRVHVKASHTLSLLTLKPGLFTNQGRDAAGTVWLDSLGVDTNTVSYTHLDVYKRQPLLSPMRTTRSGGRPMTLVQMS